MHQFLVVSQSYRQVKQAVRACETDLKHKSIIGHHQHSHHGLEYIKTSKVPSDKSRVRINDLRIAIRGSNLPFCGSLYAFFVKFTNQHFPSVRIFVMRETTEFLFTLQARHISGYLKL